MGMAGDAVRTSNGGSHSVQGGNPLRHIDFSAALKPRPTGLFPALQASEALLYAGAREDCFALFPGSSVVEQPAVNRLVAGSNPARGANNLNFLQGFQLNLGAGLARLGQGQRAPSFAGIALLSSACSLPDRQAIAVRITDAPDCRVVGDDLGAGLRADGARRIFYIY